MQVTINPSLIHGGLNAPASKSSMQRACALALLHDGQTTIVNPGKSNDDLAAIDIIQILGAITEHVNEGLLVKSKGIITGTREINCGESGLGVRMFTPIAALSSHEILINGEGSLLKRPMLFFDEILPQLGVSIESNNGYLPVKINGPLVPADITMDGSLSSQFLTGILMAFGKAAQKPVIITVKDLKSKPYIDLTLQMMKTFGFELEHDNYERFLIKPQIKEQGAQIINVEGDWSGAAFLLVAGAIAGPVTVEGLDINSAQADKAILQALMDCGCNISIEEKRVVINTALSSSGMAFQFNATDCPDLFPPLVALAAYCKGTSVIKGVSRLQHKESNRAITLQQEFDKMGVDIKLQDDLMMITGTTKLNGATVWSHHDHRIAMACAVAALKANGTTVITDAEAVNKSYPEFYADLKLLDADVSLPINQ